MANMDNERIAAFGKIQQAIREDDLWSAAWNMSKFLKAYPSLSKSESKWMKVEYTSRIQRAHDCVKLLEQTSREHAKQALSKWLGDGICFAEVEKESISIHHRDTNHLFIQISTYGRAAAYLLEIINMKPPTGKCDIKGPMELESMARCPGLHGNEVVTAPEDWVVIRREEAGEGDYHGEQWCII